MAEFDEHAATYERDLGSALAVSGESPEYFAAGRMVFLSGLLASAGRSAGVVLDFGCGTGNGLPFARQHLQPDRLAGCDISDASLEIARQRHPWVSFHANDQLPAESFDLAYCNGVVHHVPVPERQAMFAEVFRCVKPGGWFALFENSRWNPATRFVMSRCAFDRNAVPLSAAEARRWMRGAGFRVLGTRYLFVFPAALAPLRRLENSLSPLPLGTQFVVWAEKPC
jgi:SAM-dependent methyltransferase